MTAGIFEKCSRSDSFKNTVTQFKNRMEFDCSHMIGCHQQKDVYGAESASEWCQTSQCASANGKNGANGLMQWLPLLWALSKRKPPALMPVNSQEILGYTWLFSKAFTGFCCISSSFHEFHIFIFSKLKFKQNTCMAVRKSEILKLHTSRSPTLLQECTC